MGCVVSFAVPPPASSSSASASLVVHALAGAVTATMSSSSGSTTAAVVGGRTLTHSHHTHSHPHPTTHHCHSLTPHSVLGSRHQYMFVSFFACACAMPRQIRVTSTCLVSLFIVCSAVPYRARFVSPAHAWSVSSSLVYSAVHAAPDSCHQHMLGQPLLRLCLCHATPGLASRAHAWTYSFIC